MLLWLNTNLGTEWATYAGVFISIIALLWGGNKYISHKKGSQIANVKNGTVIQSGRDTNIRK